MRIEALLRRNAVQFADRPALIEDHRRLTWSELDAEVNKLANALRARGYREQERVAVVLTNSCDIPIAYFALWKCNLVSVAVNPKLTVPEIRRILQHSGASAVICESSPAVEAAADAPTVRDVFHVGDHLPGAQSLREVMEASSTDDPPVLGTGDDLRSLRYTSGTTGLPKGCMATHRQQLASVSNFLIEVEVPRTGPTFLSVPMTLGVGAFYLTAVTYLGVPLLIRSRFDAAAFRADVDKHGVTHAFLVPTMLVDLAKQLDEHGRWDDSPLSLIGYGGATISWDVVRTVRDGVGCGLYQGLGATEAGGYATLLTPDDHDHLLSRDNRSPIVSVGRPAAYARVRIVDERGEEVPRGETGELQLASASTFSGYWSQPEETRTAIRDGWLSLGDLAWQDDRGYVYLVDRKQGVIRSGSQNVYAAEVEAVVQSCPGVNRAGVVGVPDPRFGEVVKALVEKADGAEVTAEELIDFCAARLANYKRPRLVEFVPAIPVDDGGKVRRAELKKLSEAAAVSPGATRQEPQ